MWTTNESVRLYVVISRGQSHNPEKRALEDQLAEAAATIPGIAVAVVPHLYDLAYDGPVYSHLRRISEPLAVFAWLYERATRWILDRNGVRGVEGQTSLRNMSQDDEDLDDTGDDTDENPEGQAKATLLEERPLPDRPVYCFDLRLRSTVDDFLSELRRIVASLSVPDLLLSSHGNGDAAGNGSKPLAASPSQARHDTEELMNWVSGNPSAQQLERYLAAGDLPNPTFVQRLEEVAERRWYPVIDYSRCTNCMECIDFCLFGVYGVDGSQRILVEQPDNCRKGCPACSRVCPENAIIFPQHKTPAIAGAPASVGGLKIDLSKLFGGDPLELAVQERDEQLVLAGREAVGMSVGIPKRQAHRSERAADDLDKLLDKLDAMDL